MKARASSPGFFEGVGRASPGGGDVLQDTENQRVLKQVRGAWKEHFEGFSNILSGVVSRSKLILRMSKDGLLLLYWKYLTSSSDCLPLNPPIARHHCEDVTFPL